MWANPWGGSWPIHQSAYQNIPHEQGETGSPFVHLIYLNFKIICSQILSAFIHI